MIRKILLLPAGNDIDGRAVVRAVSLAKASGAAIEIFGTVYEPLLEGYMGSARIRQMYAPLRERLIDEALSGLEELAAGVRGQGVECRARAVWSAQRHEAVAGTVLTDRFDLVVTALPESAHALPHTDWKLVSTCPTPILLVMSDGKRPYGHVVAGVDPYHEHGKPAELDTFIVRNAKTFAELGGGEVRVAHCFTPLADFAGAHAADLPAAQAEEALETARRQALERLVAEEELPAASALLLRGRPEKALLSMAERGEADLFVIGVASRGRIREFFIGSTAERLLRSAATDTLVVKPPDFKVSVTVNPIP